VTFNAAVAAATTTGYCMSTTHTGGSGKTYFATASTGISETACTTAN
jgi:hypothetical protein